MKETVILYTAKKSGEVHHDFCDLSYLDKEWFQKNPVKAPGREDTGSASGVFPQRASVAESGFPEEQGVDVNPVHEIVDDGKSHLQQVNIRYMYIAWLTRDQDSLDFLHALSSNPDCLDLFANKNLQDVIDFMWNIA